MLRFVRRESTSWIVALCVLWHTSAGCCGHHGHANSDVSEQATGVAACCSDSANHVEHRCGHDEANAIHNASVGVDMGLGDDSARESESAAESLGNKSRPGPCGCGHGKCSFAFTEWAPKTAATDLDTLDGDRGSAAMGACEFVLAGWRQESLISLPVARIRAQSARPQQILCVWRL